MNNMSDEINRRILVIDDNHSIHDDFRKILASSSAPTPAVGTAEAALFGPSPDAVRQTVFEVDSAYQGQDGLLLVEKALTAGRPYAMAFVDVRMPPGWDGVETTRRIWEIDPDLQIVLCTAYSDYSWDEMFAKLGQHDGLLILKKPFDAVEALQLAHAFTEKWWLHRQARQKMEALEDIVARRTSELVKTNESLLLLQSAIEQAQESIIITGAELNQPGPKIVFVNPAFTKMTGYTAAEAIGKTPRILQGSRTDKAVLSRLRKNLERGEVFVGEAVNYRKSGEEFYLEWQIAPVRNVGGTITNFVAIQHDITARKQLEVQLFQSQKLETVGRLAGGIAHEFNSLLTTIIGQSELLTNDLPPESPLALGATEIRKAAQRAATLTRQLLAYGRKQFLEPEILSLNTVITGMESMLRHLAGRNVEVHLDLAADLKSVKADAGQIEQVIVNIVMNATDAMPNGGKITLATANVALDAEDTGRFPELRVGNYTLLTIGDTGPGMSDEVKARVFEPFFTTKNVGEGTGLGLATCYGIIKQSGGHIAVYSESGRGTTFKIYLPQVEPEIKVPPDSQTPPRLPRGMETILFVEDNPSLREMGAVLLSRLGYKVLAAANGVEAMNLAQQPDTGRIDLLFTDVVMSQMSDQELADRICALYPHTKILFTSAHTGSAAVHQSVLNKGMALLQKPFTPSTLAHKVRAVLDGATKTQVPPAMT
jgi:PAS domain S-box-containing protein